MRTTIRRIALPAAGMRGLRWFARGILAALMVLCVIWEQGAMASTVELLGQPCRAKQTLGGCLIKDRADGRERLVLADTNEIAGCELIFIDFERDTARSYRAPAGQGSWAVVEVPGDRLVVGTFYDGKFIVFDLRTMTFVADASFPGESYIWDLALGSDGRIYGGTYPGAKLGALDLRTYAVEDCGAPTTPPNLYLRHVSATPEGRILCSFGQSAPTTRLYDPATKRFEDVPPQLEGVAIGVSWNGYFLAGSRVFRGGSLEALDSPPFPTPPADKGAWWINTDLTNQDALFLHQGGSVYRYARGEQALTFIADVDLHGGRLLAASAGGALLGVRGQSYFVLGPQGKPPAFRRIPAESSPRPPLFLKADDRGRLWGGPDFGQTLFYLDTRTGNAVNTDVICDAGGEVYDVTFIGGKVYAASYSGGDITEYDPNQPWDQWNHKNPRPLAVVGPAYVRPTGGIMAGPGGKLYSGWMARYGTYGGAVAITDPATGATELIENPLGEQAVEGLAVDDRCAYVGTSLDANGLPAKRGESPSFGVIELATRRVVFKHTFYGAGAVRNFAYDRKTKRLAMTAGGRLWVFDTCERRFLRDLGTDAPAVDSSILAPGNGRIYYGSGNSIVAFDLRTGDVTPIADTPATVALITAGPDGTLYFSHGADVYRVKPVILKERSD